MGASLAGHLPKGRSHTPFRISLMEKCGFHGFFLELVSMEILIGGHDEAMTINHDNQIAQIRRKVQDDGIEIFF